MNGADIDVLSPALEHQGIIQQQTPHRGKKWLRTTLSPETDGQDELNKVRMKLG